MKQTVHVVHLNIQVGTVQNFFYWTEKKSIVLDLVFYATKVHSQVAFCWFLLLSHLVLLAFQKPLNMLVNIFP